MPAREGQLGQGHRRTRRLVRELGVAARDARLRLGRSQADVAADVGISRAYYGRIERGEVRDLRLGLASRICAVLGLDLVLRTYSSGVSVRDVAHLKLLGRFERQVSPPFRVTNESPISGGPHGRAWDRRLSGPVSVGVEAETRLGDIQALEREMVAKQHDSNVQRMILAVRDTRHNRLVLRAVRPQLRATFPLGTREVLDSLRAGSDPGANGIVIL
jgi:transcriptional regulator with XRE-family HTH domain